MSEKRITTETGDTDTGGAESAEPSGPRLHVVRDGEHDYSGLPKDEYTRYPPKLDFSVVVVFVLLVLLAVIAVYRIW